MNSESDPLSLTGKRWLWPAPFLSTWLSEFLQKRNLAHTAEEIAIYLKPLLSALPDPQHLADMEQALRRLTQAINQQERITVYGDYDVDGVSATTIIVDFLRSIGVAANYYIPDRRLEGYGLNSLAITELSKTTDLLITADCGITAHREIALARELGLDVITVDHHQLTAEGLPPALANLNPQRQDCNYPFKNLCAAGVAFMLLIALRRHLREQGFFSARGLKEPDVKEALDLVALATVADMVPLQRINRILVASGLKQISKTKRIGLRELLRVSKIDPSLLTASDLGFKLGPRINASGRIQHAASAVDLLLTTDPLLARTLAEELDAANQERRAIEETTIQEAIVQILEENLEAAAGLVLYAPHWHPGVLGLVASRITSKFNRPTIAIGEGGKGSGRSNLENLNLHACLVSMQHLLERFGGHTAAAGVTINPAKLPAIRAAFDAAVRSHSGLEPPFIPTLKPDFEIHSDYLHLKLLDSLEKLEPFGHGNPEVLLVSRNLKVKSKQLLGGKHLKLKLSQHETPCYEAIGFGLGELYDRLPEHIDIAFHVEKNIYQGRESLQLRLRDLRASTGDG